MIQMVDEARERMDRGPRIVVVGVGGGGSNAVDAMSSDGSMDGVEFVVVNTDLQALNRARTPKKIHIGSGVTNGLGTGANPALGEKAAEEDRTVLREAMDGADLVFITAGLGGGTGSGASSIIADMVKEIGAVSVAITTKPFDFEGSVRRNHADKYQLILRKKCDTLITVPNQRLISIVDENTTLTQAFQVADSVLKQCVQSISDLITRPGQINLDFADIKAVMDSSVQGTGAVMGVGYGQGEHRAREAFQQASSSPLMEEVMIQGAKGILVNITAPPNVTLHEINAAMNQYINAKADPSANVIFGVVIDENMDDDMKVTILASGFSRTSEDEGAASASMDNYERDSREYERPAWKEKADEFPEFYPETIVDDSAHEPVIAGSSSDTPSYLSSSAHSSHSSHGSHGTTEREREKNRKDVGRVLPQIFGSMK
ncbi:MAG: cell division protein FtsZ [bacterium]